MASKLEQLGYELIAKNAAKFNADTQKAEKQVSQLEKTLQKMSGSKGIPPALQSSVSGFLNKIGPLKEGLSGLTSSLGGAGSAGTAAAGGIGAAVAPVAALAAAAVVAIGVTYKLGQAIFELGSRGARLEGIVIAFDRITASAGIMSQQLLGQLSWAAHGTISDLELMRMSNLALAGATGQVAQEIGKNLPKILEIARVQARATGQDVDFLFQSLVTGVKRSSPLLIDNTGLVLDVTAANEAYAASLGISAKALTEDQKQIALMNALLESGQKAIATYGDTSITAAERLARIPVLFENLVDKFSLAMQPMFDLAMTIIDTLLHAVVYPIENFVIPVFYEMEKVVAGFLLPIFAAFEKVLWSLLDPLFDFGQEVLPYVILGIRILGNVLSWLGNQIANGIKFWANLFNKFFKFLFGDVFSPKKFFEGGARALGALARGILQVANDYIFPAVLFIARTISEFLMGMSPPPKGPLSTIDVGGANVMQAWLDGFTGVSLDPIEGVAAWVDQQLGEIGTMTLPQVEGRLSQLDRALLPFQNRLDILKARAEAVTKPFTALQNMIEKKLNKSINDMFMGKTSADAVRALDQQAEAVRNRLAAESDLVAQGEYQLALAQSAQADERARLAIQMARLRLLEQGLPATVTAADTAGTSAHPSSGGSAEAAAESTAGMGGIGIDPNSDPLGALFGIDEAAIAAAAQGLTDAFNDGFGNGDQLAIAQGNLAALQAEMGKISSSSGFSKIKGIFDGLFGSGEDSLVGKVTGFVNTFTTLWDSAFGETGLVALAFDWWVGHVENGWNLIFGSEGIIPLADFSTLIDTFEGAFGDPDGEITSTIDDFINLTEDVWNSIFGDEGLIAKLDFTNAQSLFDSAFGPDGEITKIVNGFFDIMDSIFKVVTGGKLFDLLGSFGATIGQLILSPFIGIANLFIATAEKMMNGLIDAINGILGNSFVQDAMGLIGDTLGVNLDVTLGHIEIPRIGDIPAGRLGGIFGGGAFQVHKDEILFPIAGQQTAVFPQSLSRKIMRTLAPPPTMSRYAPTSNETNNSYDNRQTTNINFNGQQTGQSTRLIIAQTKAMTRS